MKAVITGGDGFLGSGIARHSLSLGWTVTCTVRNISQKRLPALPVRWLGFDFPDRLDTAIFEPLPDVIIHAAFTTRDVGARYQDNRLAARHLLGAARDCGVPRFVFISSMSAHPKAESRYGKEKLFIEGMLDRPGEVSIRPGFVIGPGGVFRNLVASIRALPAIPHFYGGRQPIHTVALDDACRAIEAAIVKNIDGMIAVGERRPVSLAEFYRAIAAKLGLRRPAIRLPGSLTLEILRLAETAGLRLPLTSENLLGLKNLIQYDLTRDIDLLGFEPKTMQKSLTELNWDDVKRSL